MIIDGQLNDWTDADRLDASQIGNLDWPLYGKVDGDRFVFALHALSGAAIGAGTTFWLNTDRNAATGYQIFGQYGGAEYNVNFTRTASRTSIRSPAEAARTRSSSARRTGRVRTG